ncbi:MerR family transcriptional regulator [Agromyces atrinae]|uniref:MerR family transcriptional regulator n=1 Tax=Agromyces atrinae TaxID=592376 RepID=UPI001F56546F|nr:MerR family transcriptional regulator [Agromyces atrinae]MCI2958472.1 MerR family transcriptional regulator [Agromyces atrinae]
MQSVELARLAGVSVRALRHYHSVGVLPEPPRSHSGYRRYSVHDLVRVLRIKRLASLGIPLEGMPPLLDDDSTSAAPLLERLDAELAAEIDRLERQRALIADLRENGTPPALPPALARFVGLGGTLPPSSALDRLDRDQAVLLAHVVGDEGLPGVVEAFERLAVPELREATVLLTQRFDALDDATPREDVDAFVADFAVLFGPVVAELTATGLFAVPDSATDLLATLAGDLLNETQQRVIERFDELFPAPPREVPPPV